MTKRQFLQYIKWLPAQLGMFSKGAFLLQIRAIRKNDLFIVSYPKSGNTWLRFIVAYLKHGVSKEIKMDELEHLVPDVYISKEIIDSLPGGRIIKTHDPLFRYFPKMIYIYRDYRDVLVSYYHYRTGVKEFTGSFSEFLRSEFIEDHFGSWPDHIEGAFKTKKERPGSILILKYEEQLRDFKSSAEAICNFCGFGREVDLHALGQLTAFDALKQNERNHGSAFQTLSNTGFFRQGKAGSWKNHFKKEDLEFIYGQKNVKNTLLKLGYTIDPL